MSLRIRVQGAHPTTASRSFAPPSPHKVSAENSGKACCAYRPATHQPPRSSATMLSATTLSATTLSAITLSSKTSPLCSAITQASQSPSVRARLPRTHWLLSPSLDGYQIFCTLDLPSSTIQVKSYLTISQGRVKIEKKTYFQSK